MKYSQLIITGMLAVFCGSCKKDFLQRDPKTEITQNDFFKTPEDLETYTNGFYAMMVPAFNNATAPSFADIYSDNISVYTGGSETDVLIRGGITPSTVEGWNTWDKLRGINFMLDNVQQTAGDAERINHYIGIAKFFRAYFYYNMVKLYGDVPWYGHVLNADDELLYKSKDPRTLIVDSVMNDLEFAAEHISADGDNTGITKWSALTLLARTALHEGTYRKYHDELQLQSTANAFLEKAAEASQQIIDGGAFSIYKTTGGGQDFRTLFSSGDLSGNPEVIFLHKSSKTEGISNVAHYVFDWQWALSRSLADEFLMTDGTPFTSQPNYDKKTFVQIFQNRDPRMAETIMPPGFTINPPDGLPYLIKPNFGGLLQVKFYPGDPALRGGNDDSYTDMAIFRYAEILLINAEAKAELGTVTQADIDNTINLLRDRVNMPPLDMAYANAHADAKLAAEYPLVNGADKGLLLEIRRERRVEMAAEGLRYDDLYRWKAGALLGMDSQGMYVPSLGALDVTGDGQYDIAILEAPGAEDPIAGLPENVKNSLVKYYLSDHFFYLSNNNAGFVMFVKDKEQPRNFIEPKYYYRPIPLQQTLLNTHLTQPEGWQ
jgi:hypothetical protein